MAKFTTLGATGRLGPTSVGMNYNGQDHEQQVTVNKGIQMWKVPATGMYTIEATGAAGGYDKFTSCKYEYLRKERRGGGGGGGCGWNVEPEGCCFDLQSQVVLKLIVASPRLKFVT